MLWLERLEGCERVLVRELREKWSFDAVSLSNIYFYVEWNTSSQQSTLNARHCACRVNTGLFCENFVWIFSAAMKYALNYSRSSYKNSLNVLFSPESVTIKAWHIPSESCTLKIHSRMNHSCCVFFSLALCTHHSGQIFLPFQCCCWREKRGLTSWERESKLFHFPPFHTPLHFWLKQQNQIPIRTSTAATTEEKLPHSEINQQIISLFGFAILSESQAHRSHLHSNIHDQNSILFE